MSSPALRWSAFAVAGLLVALAVALAATHMVSERIGISAEPVSAGVDLSPNRGTGSAGTAATSTVTTQSIPPTATVSPPASNGSDEYSQGGGDGGGEGHGGDD